MTTNEQTESDELVTIREAFAQFMYEPGTGRDIPDWRADFDVWLAGERHRVAEQCKAAVRAIHYAVFNGGVDTDYGYQELWVCASKDHAGVASRDWPCAIERTIESAFPAVGGSTPAVDGEEGGEEDDPPAARCTRCRGRGYHSIGCPETMRTPAVDGEGGDGVAAIAGTPDRFGNVIMQSTGTFTEGVGRNPHIPTANGAPAAVSDSLPLDPETIDQAIAREDARLAIERANPWVDSNLDGSVWFDPQTGERVTSDDPRWVHPMPMLTDSGTVAVYEKSGAITHAPSHEFIGVTGHPDDNECTHREGGSAATYCGLPESMHRWADRARAESRYREGAGS